MNVFLPDSNMSAYCQRECLEDGNGVKQLREVHVNKDEQGACIREVQFASDMHEVHVDGEWDILKHDQEVRDSQSCQYSVDGSCRELLVCEDNNIEQVGNNTKRAYHETQDPVDFTLVHIPYCSNITVAETSTNGTSQCSGFYLFQRQVCEFQQVQIVLITYREHARIISKHITILRFVLVSKVLEGIIEFDH